MKEKQDVDDIVHQKFDYVIENGNVIDPKSHLRTIANIGIKGDKIGIVTRENLLSDIKIDAKNKIVCPGFIDPHCHIDGYLYNAQCYVKMGVTTAITGNCGFGPYPIKAFLDKIDSRGFPINHGTLIGHSFDLRKMVGLGNSTMAPTENEIAKMVEIAQESLEEGALGISLGLEYAPGSTQKEIYALARLAAKYDKVMPVHSRSDGWGSLAALQEIVSIQQETGVRVLISHLTYQNGMGMMKESLSIIEKAYEQGFEIYADSGAYDAFATFIGSEVFCKGWREKYQCQYEDVMVSSGQHMGKRLNEALFHELVENDPKTLCTAFVGCPHEVVEALQQPYVMVSSDGAVGSHQPGTGHPQDAGTYPKVFRKFVRQMNALTMMEAVAKCTIIPAKFFKLENKGWIGTGADADIVVFDPNSITDTSDYAGMGIPDASPEGIEWVFVNGCPVVKNSELDENAMPGRAVRQKNKIWRV